MLISVKNNSCYFYYKFERVKRDKYQKAHLLPAALTISRRLLKMNRKIRSLVFPDGDRSFRGMRWVNISLRSVHLVGIVGLGGAILCSLPFSVWKLYLLLTVLSGSSMLVLSIWCNGVWFIQLRGIAMLLKLTVLPFCVFQDWSPIIIVFVIVISGVIAHAPGSVRYYQIFNNFQNR